MFCAVLQLTPGQRNRRLNTEVQYTPFHLPWQEKGSTVSPKQTTHRSSVNMEAVAEYLDASADAFEARAMALFDGQPSRFNVLREEQKTAEPLAAVRSEMAGSAESGGETCVQFWRLMDGDYVLPTAWAPDANVSIRLRFLMLNGSPADSLTVSTDDGATNFTFQAGESIEIDQPCMFWVAPVEADSLYLAVSGQTARVQTARISA